MTEIETKLTQVRELLSARSLDGILVKRNANFAWLSGGACGYVNTATDFAAANLLVTRDAAYVLTNNIEAPRLEEEERLVDLGFRPMIAPWHQSNVAAEELLGRLRLGADDAQDGAVDVSADLARLHLSLVPVEVARFRELGRLCAAAMNEAIRGVRLGMTEFEIAGLLSQATLSRGALPIVNLIATDERIYRFRHPLPTGKTLTRYAMLVLCGRRHGLVASVTRLVHFGPLPDDVRRKAEACARVDATFLAHTRPGARLGDVFGAAVDAYAAEGYPGEWQLHHQGGPASYEPRDFVATPDSTEVVRENQVYAWNPSITGVKSEDTILVGASGNEVLTAIDGWPLLEVQVAGQSVLRPAILEVGT
jgi:Xaa-Pro aminopeptidase